MQALKLPMRNGWRWLAGGFAIFRRSAPLLALVVVGYWMLIGLINAIPVIGAVIATVCIPAFSVSLMNVCRRIDQGEPADPRLLFSGFQENLRPLLVLGVIYLAATLLVLSATTLADDGVLFRMMALGQPPGEEAFGSEGFMLATQIGMLLFTPLMMAYWYAPVLTAWHGCTPAKALFFSFFASMRNWRAFLAYGASLVVFAGLVPGLLLGLLSSLVPDSGSFFAALLSVPLLLVLAPTLFASFYVSYREVFVGIESDA